MRGFGFKARAGNAGEGAAVLWLSMATGRTFRRRTASTMDIQTAISCGKCLRGAAKAGNHAILHLSRISEV